MKVIAHFIARAGERVTVVPFGHCRPLSFSWLKNRAIDNLWLLHENFIEFLHFPFNKANISVVKLDSRIAFYVPFIFVY